MKTKIENFLQNLETEIDILNCIDIDNIDMNNAYESIYEMIEDSNGFNIEIIYYHKAMEFLLNNDNSLRDSFEIASELGYNVSDLNSEILASLLASKLVREEFCELEDEINNFFEDITNN